MARRNGRTLSSIGWLLLLVVVSAGCVFATSDDSAVAVDGTDDQVDPDPPPVTTQPTTTESATSQTAAASATTSTSGLPSTSPATTSEADEDPDVGVDVGVDGPTGEGDSIDSDPGPLGPADQVIGPGTIPPIITAPITIPPTITAPTSTPGTEEPGTEEDEADDPIAPDARRAGPGQAELGNGRGTAEVSYPTVLEVEQEKSVVFTLRVVDFRPDGELYDQSDGSRIVAAAEAREKREWPVYGALGPIEVTLWAGDDLRIVDDGGVRHSRFFREGDRAMLEARFQDPDAFASLEDKLGGFADLHALLRGGLPADLFVELSDVLPLPASRCRSGLPSDPTIEEFQADVLCRYESLRTTLQASIVAGEEDEAVDQYLEGVRQIQSESDGRRASRIIEFDPDGFPNDVRWRVTALCDGSSELRFTADRLAVAFPNPSDFPDDDQLAAFDPDELNLWLELDVVSPEGACLSDVDFDNIYDETDPERPVPAGRPVDLCPRDALPTVDRREQTTDTDGDGQGDACDDDIDGDGIPNATDAEPKVPSTSGPGQESDSVWSRFGRWVDGIPLPAALAGLALPLVAALARLLVPLRRRAGTDELAPAGPTPLTAVPGGTIPSTTEPPTGLVLSGGGMRAAAFSLGVILYLLDAGRLGSLRNVASVSGGSFTNARMVGLLATDDPAARRSHLRHYRDQLASNGLPLERASAWFVLATIGLIVFLARLLTGWSQLWIVAAILGLWVVYSLVAQAVVRRWLSHLCGIERSEPVAGIVSPLRHWFTSAEAGRFPIHISREVVVHLGDDDRGDAGRRNSIPSDDLRLSEVVRASAAFPGLPPVVLSATALGRAPHQTGIGRLLGGRWVLRDGGLFDNLGHIVATLDDPDTYAEFTERGAISRWLVVDASAGAAETKRSLFAGVLAKLNIGLFPTVLQMGAKASADQTTASQRELRARFGRGEPLLLVDLGATAETVADLHQTRGDERDPLDSWLADQHQKGADASAILNSLAVVSTVPTTLGSIGIENTNDLIRHGYTVAMCHFILQEPGAPRLDDLDRWRKLDPLDDAAVAELRPPSP